MWRLNDVQLVMRGPKCAKTISPHHYTPPAWTVETRQNGSMFSCSLRQILTLPSECCRRNRDSTDQATFFQSSIVQFCCACVNCSLRVLFLRRFLFFCCCKPICWVRLCVRLIDGILHTLGCNEWFIWVTVAFLSSNQSAHSPLTSDINKAFCFSDHSL